MNDDEFEQFLEQANDELKVKQAALSQQYGLGHLGAGRGSAGEGFV